MKGGTLKIFAQRSKEKLEDFVSGIKNAPEPIVVEKISSKETRVKASLKRFEIVVGTLANEMLEGFGAMESQFGDYRQEFREFDGEFGN